MDFRTGGKRRSIGDIEDLEKFDRVWEGEGEDTERGDL